MAIVQERPQPFPWRAAAPSLAVSGALLAVTFCAASALYVSHRSTAAALARATDGFDAAVELELGVRELREQLTQYVLSGEERRLEDLTRLRNAAAGNILRIETVVITPEGRRLIAAIRHSFADLDDQLRGLSALQREVQRQQILRLINDVLDGEILARAKEQRTATREAVEAARQENARLLTFTGWTLTILGLAGTLAGVFSGYNLARAWQRQLVELSISVRTAAGSLEPVTGGVEPIAIEPSGDLSYVNSMVSLLSDRVSTVVERLQAAEREAMRQDQLAALGQLAAGLAHELRNPLTAIKTLVEAARTPGAGQGLDDQDLQVIEEELARLDGTLQSFLDYARPPKLARRQADLCEVVDRTVQLVRPQAERQSVRIETDLPAEPVQLILDPEQVRQVLLNLLLNALQAIGDGGRIIIRLAADPEAEAVTLTVDDNGPGIRPDLLNRLFDPFVSSKPSGTGLGLTICRRIIEEHGGTLTAENLPEGGARFRLQLPRHVDGPLPSATSLATDPAYADIADHR